MLLFGDLIKLPHIDIPDKMLTMLLDKSSLSGIPEKLLHQPGVHYTYFSKMMVAKQPITTA